MFRHLTDLEIAELFENGGAAAVFGAERRAEQRQTSPDYRFMSNYKSAMYLLDAIKTKLSNNKKNKFKEDDQVLCRDVSAGLNLWRVGYITDVNSRPEGDFYNIQCCGCNLNAVDASCVKAIGWIGKPKKPDAYILENLIQLKCRLHDMSVEEKRLTRQAHLRSIERKANTIMMQKTIRQLQEEKRAMEARIKELEQTNTELQNSSAPAEDGENSQNN